MSAYDEAFGGGRAKQGPVAFWKRPVPLYAAAAALVVMIGVSFVAGQRAPVQGTTPADGAVTSADIEWSAAENDLL